MSHLLTREFIAVSAVLHALRLGTRPCSTSLVRKPAITEATIAPDILGCVLLMAEDFPLPVNQFLSDSRIIRTCSAQVTVVTEIAHHVLHGEYPPCSEC